VTLAAGECNRVPDMVPSRWRFDHFEACTVVAPDQVNIGVWTIFSAIWLEAFIWGTGTAIGEMPPYFIARAASLAGGKADELEEILKAESMSYMEKVEHNKLNKNEGFFDRHKLTLMKFLNKHAFLTVLAMAAVPNPLFDLAGLMCGHFLIPFWTFFTACWMGKSLCKVNLQAMLIICVFSRHIMDSTLHLFEGWFPEHVHSLETSIEGQKKILF
jgi:vacuole membrane protein 1